MICFAKPVLTEDMCVVQKEEFSIPCGMCDTYTLRKAKHFIRDKPIFSSERMLHKNYYRKVSAKKKKDLWSWVSRSLAPR
jgi:CTP:phosphocholine cytidylyltransferase-like protein